jgi:hypothetical protein
LISGDVRGAGTDANVSIELYGANGKSGPKKLDAKGNPFERAAQDTFSVESIDLGELSKIRIWVCIYFSKVEFLFKLKILLINNSTIILRWGLLGSWIELLL